WGGDVSRRIASNMGNSIFVAAYLIMANPLTILRIYQSFGAILREESGTLIQMAKSTAYVFIACLQVVALYFTGSRGPWLGWMAGIFFMFVLLSLYWRKRYLLFSFLGVGTVIGVMLLVFNIPGGPLEAWRFDPNIGRLGHLFDAEGGTGRVRVLIWQGAAKLVSPHAPLEYPDGRLDALNALRPLIGYGPEGMYVAYNRFYPPELGSIERRNATPDRSHNETWDALATTGVFGLVAYLTLYAFAFYYGLRWMGLIPNSKYALLFAVLCLSGAVAGAIGLVSWREVAYLGIGLPLGMVAGILIYLIIAAIFGHYKTPTTLEESARALIIMTLLAVIVAHFIEINLGIAIAATHTYFWSFLGMLVVCGYRLPGLEGAEQAAPAETVVRAQTTDVQGRQVSPRRARRAGRVKTQRSLAAYLPGGVDTLIGSFILAILLICLGYDFISGAQGANSAGAILWSSMVRLKSVQSGISYGVLAMLVTTWLMAGIVLASEGVELSSNSAWLKKLASIWFLGLFLAGVFWLMHSGMLASLARQQTATIAAVLGQVRRYENLLTQFYLVLFALLLFGAFFIFARDGARTGATWRGILTTILAVPLAFFVIGSLNLRVIQADIAFKLTEPFTRENSWPVAIEIYKRSLELAPSEDYYYLFLGRAYLEYAKTLEDPAERDALISQAAEDLKAAQKINPLNTDHTANLARLHSLWAGYATETNVRLERGMISDEYFEKALVLSPNNSRIWDEWAILYLNILDQPQRALELLQRSAELDPYYDWTHALLGEYYGQESELATDPTAREKNLDKSIFHFSEATRLARDTSSKLNYTLAQAQLYISRDDPQTAIDLLQEALGYSPGQNELWRIQNTMAQLYVQLGDKSNAMFFANQALLTAPEDQKVTIQTLLTQIQAMP
ncbi:MAG: O-antigen ligase family protein, partial [Anaerolineales bacterium]|nr:O-antigen ligase family protein [Anaerolineales bacterium]